MKHNYILDKTKDNTIIPYPFQNLFQFWDHINFYLEDTTIRKYLNIIGIDVQALSRYLTPEYKIESQLLMKQYTKYPTVFNEIFKYLYTHKTKLDFLEKYSAEQIKYITSLDLSDSKLIACAGSGKTRSIIGRIKFLVEHGLAEKNEIFAITFSKLAATDFHKKIQDLFPNYRSFCQLNNFSTIDSLAKSILDRIKSHKSNNMEILSIAFRNYLRKINPIEVKLISEFKMIKHLFIDEAQDLNEIQYEMALLLKEKFGTKLYFIGDPNQNIFQFRRSSNEYLINFPGTKYELTLNFRSSQQIINFSEGLKPITTTKSISATRKTGPKVTIWIKPKNEIKQLFLDFIKNYQKDLSNIAIICPTRGIKLRNDIGLAFIFNFLKMNKIPVNQLYDESGKDNQRKDNAIQEGHINLLTYHGTKGLEFDVVFVMDFYQFLFNRQPTEKNHQIHRYLLYVATSRAISTMYICTYSNINSGYLNHWITKVNKKYYTAADLRIPKLEFRNKENEFSIHGITDLIGEMSDEHFDKIDDMIKISEKNNYFTRRIYQDFTKIDRKKDEILFGLFCEDLFYWQYFLARKMAPRKFELIEKIIKAKFIKIDDEKDRKELKKYITKNNLTWRMYDMIKHDIPKHIQILIGKYFTRAKELNEYIICSNEFTQIIEENKKDITNAYTKYTNPKNYSYDYKKCLEEFFYLIVVQYAYNINHYYYIMNKGIEKKHILDNRKELFKAINEYAKNNYLTCDLDIKRQVFYSKLGILGEIDFIEKYKHSETIVEIKCAKKISIKYYIQLFLYNFCYYYKKHRIDNLYCNKFKIVNLLTGLEHYFIIRMSPADVFSLLSIVADIGNLTFKELNLVYDLETTGLIKDDNYPEIIEISIKDYESEMIIIDTLVKPKSRISHKIISITGITNQMVKNKSNINELRNIIGNKMKKFNNCIMMAHNGNGFDHKIIKNDKLVDTNRILFMDTLNLIPVHLPSGIKLDSKKLGVIYRRLFNKDFKAHRAMSDVNALIKIMKKLDVRF